MRSVVCICFFVGCASGADSRDADAGNTEPDPCAGVACDSPSPPACADAVTVRTYAAHGTCAGGACTYAHIDSVCPVACQNGACVDHDPCIGVSCDSPPPPICLDDQTLEFYASQGTCSSGDCSYAPSDIVCNGGCQSGACAGDPCAGVSCTQPPAASCSDSFTLRQYQAIGSCSGGSCVYSNSFTHCPNGCTADACCVPETDDELCAAHGANCGSLSVLDRCGTNRSITSCGTCADPLVCGGTAPNLCSCAWSSEIVAQGPASVEQASMVLDSSGAPQIVFWQQDASGSNGSVIYTHKSNGSWVQTPLATGVQSLLGSGQVGGTSIARDSAGGLHVVDACNYFHYSGVAWSAAESYCKPSDKSFSASVVGSSNGTVRIAYLTQDSPAIIRYAARTAAGVWSFETIEASGPSYSTENDGVAIALMPGDVPAVAYPTVSAIHLATRASNGTWTIESAATIPMGEYTNVTMEIDSAGVVRLDYQVSQEQQEVAVRAGGVWTTADVVGWGVLPGGFPPTLTIVSDNQDVSPYSPIVIYRQNGSSFSQESIGPYSGAPVEAAIIDGSGVSGNIWILTGGYKVLNLYHRCAFP